MPQIEWLSPPPPSLPARRGSALGDKLTVRPKSINQPLPPSLQNLNLRLRLIPPLSIRKSRGSRVVRAGLLPISSTLGDFAPIPYPTPRW